MIFNFVKTGKTTARRDITSKSMKYLYFNNRTLQCHIEIFQSKSYQCFVRYVEHKRLYKGQRKIKQHAEMF